MTRYAYDNAVDDAGRDDSARWCGCVKGGGLSGLDGWAGLPQFDSLLALKDALYVFIGRGDDAELRTVALCATVVLGAGLWWAVAIALVRLFGFHQSPTAGRIVTLGGGIALLLIGAGLLATTVGDLIRSVA